ncbi:MAG: transposase [Balneolaceae bacterium]|nr:transposase [Balneolaceae bacterium]
MDAERRRLVTQQAAVETKATQSDQLPVTSEVLEEGWRRQRQLYRQQIPLIEARMQALVDEHPGLDRYYRLLTGIPGVGQVTAWLWLILFYGEKNLNPKKIATRFGFAPHSCQSDSSVHGRTRSSGHGASQMRQCMALAARSASTHYQKFRIYKQRKLDEGKPWPVVRNNLINKLIKIMCAIWSSGQSYDPNHTSRFDRQKNAA